jgi:repressor LexA
MDTITPRQQRIIDFIRDTVRDRGYPPSVREIGEAVGLTSSSSVHSQLENLERKGLLHKDPSRPRAIGLSRPGPSNDAAPPSATIRVPLVGRIAAGSPILAEQNIEDHIDVPDSFAGSGEHFALRVAGDSMTRAGILDGDVVVVRRQADASDGDVVAAVLPGPAEDEATVKRLSLRRDRVVLVPENDAMEPFEMTDGWIAGKVVTVLRKL